MIQSERSLKIMAVPKHRTTQNDKHTRGKTYNGRKPCGISVGKRNRGGSERRGRCRCWCRSRGVYGLGSHPSKCTIRLHKTRHAQCRCSKKETGAHDKDANHVPRARGAHKASENSGAMPPCRCRRGAFHDTERGGIWRGEHLVGYRP